MKFLVFRDKFSGDDVSVWPDSVISLFADIDVSGEPLTTIRLIDGSTVFVCEDQAEVRARIEVERNEVADIDAFDHFAVGTSGS